MEDKVVEEKKAKDKPNVGLVGLLFAILLIGLIFCVAFYSDPRNCNEVIIDGYSIFYSRPLLLDGYTIKITAPDGTGWKFYENYPDGIMLNHRYDKYTVIGGKSRTTHDYKTSEAIKEEANKIFNKWRKRASETECKEEILRYPFLN